MLSFISYITAARFITLFVMMGFVQFIGGAITVLLPLVAPCEPQH